MIFDLIDESENPDINNVNYQYVAGRLINYHFQIIKIFFYDLGEEGEGRRRYESGTQGIVNDKRIPEGQPLRILDSPSNGRLIIIIE